MDKIIEIRECTTIEQLGECVELQREVFALPGSRYRGAHFVNKNAGGSS